MQAHFLMTTIIKLCFYWKEVDKAQKWGVNHQQVTLRCCKLQVWMFQVLTNFYDVVSMMKSHLRHCGAIEERSLGKFGFRWNFRSLSDILQRFDANGNFFETLQRSRIKGGRLYRGVVSRGVVGPPIITGRRPDFSIFFIHNVGKG